MAPQHCSVRQMSDSMAEWAHASFTVAGFLGRLIMSYGCEGLACKPPVSLRTVKKYPWPILASALASRSKMLIFGNGVTPLCLQCCSKLSAKASPAKPAPAIATSLPAIHRVAEERLLAQYLAWIPIFEERVAAPVFPG